MEFNKDGGNLIKILVDSREQKQLSFIGLENVDSVEKRKLDIGDYSVEYNNGYIPGLVFERKSISDLFGTMGKGYKRFKKEMERAERSGTLLIIIIEGTRSDVAKGHKYSKIKGKSIIKKLVTLFIRHGVWFVYCKNRKEMALYIVDIFNGIGRENAEATKKVKKKRNKVDVAVVKDINYK